MNKNVIETQLDCRATATLRSEVALDLLVPDRPIMEVLTESKEKKDNESKDITEDSGRNSESAS